MKFQSSTMVKKLYSIKLIFNLTWNLLRDFAWPMFQMNSTLNLAFKIYLI